MIIIGRQKLPLMCDTYEISDTCERKLVHLTRVLYFIMRRRISSLSLNSFQPLPAPPARVGGGKPGLKVGEGLQKGWGVASNPQPHVKWSCAPS